MTSGASFVALEVALFRQVPLREREVPALSPGLARIALKASVLSRRAFASRESDPSLAHDRETRVAPIPLKPHAQTSRPRHELRTGPRINHRHPCGPSFLKI